MHSTALLLSADTPLGRFNEALLTDQTRMELFVTGFTAGPMAKFYDVEGDFLPVCDWPGVDCDDAGTVTDVGIPLCDSAGTFLGSLALRFLPRNILTFDMNQNWLTGGIKLEDLPPTIVEFDVNHNSLCGSIQLDGIPNSLRKLDLSSNRLSGSIDLTKISQTSQIKEIDLSSNAFMGSLSFDGLPPELQSLNLCHNAFAGDLQITRLPCTILIDLSENSLTGKATIYRTCRENVYVYGNDFQIFVDENGDEYKRTW